MINDTHDPRLRSWIDAANTSTTDFPIQNLPFGVFRRRGRHGAGRIGVAIGDHIVDLALCQERGLFRDLPPPVHTACTGDILNPLMELGHSSTSALRRRLVDLLQVGAPADIGMLVPMRDAELMMPVAVGGYTDFYASIAHATNVGKLFRPDNPLLPNYKHVPIGYHGRTSSLVISGTAVRRPWGQVKPAHDPAPSFEPSRRLDYETEIAAIIGTGNELGDPIEIHDAEQHVFGLCLLNDWSARDIQAWEYQPLGPVLGKNFATSLSPWIVTVEALAPFRCAAFARPPNDPRPLPYLSSVENDAAGGFDVTVEVYLRTASMREQQLPPVQLSRGSLADMYWTVAQMVTHHTSNGCNLQGGDLIASGTVSGTREDAFGCLLEITGGSRPIELPTGEQRLFLADGDEVAVHGVCERSGWRRIGFGMCAGVIEPARPRRGAHP